jgi:hypothetical protein
MNAAVVMLRPAPGTTAATALQPGDALLPVCLPPENRRWETTSPPPCWPRFRPPGWGAPPLPMAVDPGRLPNHSAKVLLTRLRLSYNSIGVGAAVPFNSVFVSAARHKNSSSFGG